MIQNQTKRDWNYTDRALAASCIFRMSDQNYEWLKNILSEITKLVDTEENDCVSAEALFCALVILRWIRFFIYWLCRNVFSFHKRKSHTFSSRMGLCPWQHGVQRKQRMSSVHLHSQNHVLKIYNSCSWSFSGYLPFYSPLLQLKLEKQQTPHYYLFLFLHNSCSTTPKS